MKLLLAEDTSDLNRAVTALLTHQGYEVTSAFDGAEAMEYLENDSFDGIILDIMMPKMSGLEVLSRLRANGIVTPVLLLTAKAEVDDYLTKPFAMKELLARVRSMTRRRQNYSSGEMTFANLTLRAEQLELASENTIRLSLKEVELLQALIRNAGRELSTAYLLGNVWSSEPNASADTVWLYISYLRGKLSSVGSKAVIEGERGGSFILKEA